MLSSELFLISKSGLEGLDVPVSIQSLENKIENDKHNAPKILNKFFIKF